MGIRVGSEVAGGLDLHSKSRGEVRDEGGTAISLHVRSHGKMPHRVLQSTPMIGEQVISKLLTMIHHRELSYHAETCEGKLDMHYLLIEICCHCAYYALLVLSYMFLTTPVSSRIRSSFPFPHCYRF